MKEKTETLQKLAEKLFSLMATKAKVSVDYDKENTVFVVNVEAGDETGLLIGKKGETLSSIQTVLGILFKQKTGEWNRVVVNVGDYREKEEDYLKNLATSTAERAVETGDSQNLYNLKAWQRRIIHMALSENKDVTTESEGEGEERFLIIKPKK
ncbi:MAG: R3H domain-containing nucleic acid-binding protein [Candidatus Microgenomates bacterium]|jgi:spoIIIJ-associated protein